MPNFSGSFSGRATLQTTISLQAAMSLSIVTMRRTYTSKRLEERAEESGFYAAHRTIRLRPSSAPVCWRIRISFSKPFSSTP